MTLASDHHAQSSTDNPLWFYELFFWLYWVFMAPQKLSLVAVSGAILHCDVRGLSGFLTGVALLTPLLQSMDLGPCGLQ